MKSLRQLLMLLGLLFLLCQANFLTAETKSIAPVSAHDRCAVCGMFVAKYPSWLTQLRLSDGKVAMFDGPKDMFVYYFTPEDYGAGSAKVVEIVVKDYYTQEWLDAKQAVYVTGSDVHGPMGNEFIPFKNQASAENFLKDHHGKEIIPFKDITAELVQSMRKGHKMKGHMKK